jgi:hypothetical protein
MDKIGYLIEKHLFLLVAYAHMRISCVDAFDLDRLVKW